MKHKYLAALLIILCAFSGAHLAHANDLAIAGSTTLSGSVGVAMPVTGLQITGTTPSSTPVKILTTSGTLTLGTTTGLTFTSGGASGSVLYFTGTLSAINTALASLTYTRGSAGTDTIEVSLVNFGEVFFPTNGHLYKFISGSTTWNAANAAAPSQSAYGASGYLATITSQAENDFISARIVADGWIGASDVTTEGDWKWVTGPESGTSFWSGLGASSGGHTVNSGYANWNSGEPNDSGGNEDCAEYYSGSGMWNDLPCSGSSLTGYMAEFGTPGTLPTVVAQNIAVTTYAAPSVSSFTPADNATNVSTTSSLSINFNQAMAKGTGNIVIKKSSDDSVVQTTDVTTGAVTGGGTSTITIALASPLTDLTGYYVQIPGTAFYNPALVYYAGIATTTTWNFTTGDFNPPTVASVTTSKASGAYKAGEAIPLTVTFSEAVTSTGSVTVTLETGAIDRTCTFTITGSTTGSCTYTVQAGDTSSDLDVTSVSGTIKDAALNTLVVTTPTITLASGKDIIIDTTAPVLTQISQIAPVINVLTATYLFSANETGTYTIGSCGSGSQSVITAGTSVALSGLTAETGYTCGFYLTDAAGNVSNTLTIGVFMVHLPSTGAHSAGAVPPALPAATPASTTTSTPSASTATGEVQPTSSGALHLFQINMKSGSTIADVARLQAFLKTMPGIYPEGVVSGRFGPATYRAVVRFQEKYADEVLRPIGETKGTGHVFEYTRKKLNSLLLAQ